MKNRLPVYLISCLLLLNVAFAQETTTTTREIVVYTDLEEAKKNPDAVECISLVGGKYKKFPTDIFLFKNLKYLEIRKTKIKKIPAEIGQLTKLEELNLNQNKIEELPPELFTLKRLTILQLRKNKLLQVPKEIGQLSKLEQVDFNGNEIFTLPVEIVSCGALRTMDLRNTDLSEAEIESIRNLLPGVEIFFQNTCNCGPNN